MDIQKQRSEKNDQLRELKDFFAKIIIAMGGIFVIIAVVLIFVYLLSVVFPLFKSPEIQSSSTESQAESPLYTSIDEYQETAISVYPKTLHNINLLSNTTTSQKGLLPASISSFSQISIKPAVFAWGLSNGMVALMQHQFNLSYDQENLRSVAPTTQPLLGSDSSLLALSNQPIDSLAARADEDRLTVAFYSNRELSVITYDKATSFLDDSVTLEEDLNINLPTHALTLTDDTPPKLYLSNDARWLLVVSEQQVAAFPIYDSEQATNPQIITLPNRVTASAWLLGETSLLIGDETGQVTKLFSIRGLWQPIETVKIFDTPVTRIVSEHQRKVFAAQDTGGRLQLVYAPSLTNVIEHNHQHPITGMDFAPRGNGLMIYADGQRTMLKIKNEHPEVNLKSLWGKLHYEGYDEPRYIWQSSASNQDFEAKLSLTPLTFGTLKAAFYAMLMAMPLAIMGAIFTAFFMSPQMRRIVKPSIEIMEALPTVILGFLAGLWLSPFIEQNLTAIFLTLWIVPFGVMGFGWLTFKAPKKWKKVFDEQWRAALIIPVIVLLTLASFGISSPIESLFFGGDFRQYLSQEVGITYDQRNALVVGFAMGFAVIPTIFSITEDAVFSVPKHLVNGSLALGASSWQTLMGVVIPTASPGIFSGVMIGFGRAVGETMIVLMATGNTPVMNWNIFEGMRTLAANIAVEMPESEVGSSHYRILFLAALVLFLFTFVFNTGAEVIRQRLRKKYGSL